MEHIAQQRDKVDMQESKDDPDNPKSDYFFKEITNSLKAEVAKQSLSLVYRYNFFSLLISK